ncbi:MAG: aldehyde dehydrogenase (NAD+) [Flavobacterium sp.]|jgi:aldehyde dehydrogenase (NAD+)
MVINNLQHRKNKLTQLLSVLQREEDACCKALFNDCKKPEFEAYISEVNYVLGELKNTIKNLSNWSKPKKVLSSLINFPSDDYIYNQPYGKVLIISPWNYPYQLAIYPVIAAYAAGNSVVLKPSELTPKTSELIKILIEEVFETNEVQIVLGDAEVSTKLLAQKWDYIFFTGSVAIGKIVAKAAAENLTPVTLELGGKNPCIVDETANIKIAARRIAWGKFFNAGQTCIAPDYLLVHESVKEKFINQMKLVITKNYGERPITSTDFSRIINTKNWERLNNLLLNQEIIFGGEIDKSDLYISPTLLNNVSLKGEIMKEEIFGPILPIISYSNLSEVEEIIFSLDKPLSAYLFTTSDKAKKYFINTFSFGGGCINDTMVHFTNNNLPFGGIGNSGIGAYHGKYSYDTFVHKKTVVHRANWLDITLKYPPYKNNLRFLKKILKWM